MDPFYKFEFLCNGLLEVNLTEVKIAFRHLKDSLNCIFIPGYPTQTNSLKRKFINKETELKEKVPISKFFSLERPPEGPLLSFSFQTKVGPRGSDHSGDKEEKAEFSPWVYSTGGKQSSYNHRCSRVGAKTEAGLKRSKVESWFRWPWASEPLKLKSPPL